jgi:alginate O-acetyltransferase complex protein AlgI
MVFTELRFLFFFLVVFVLHWTLSGATSRKVLLLISSYVFYSAWDWRFASLLLLSTVIDYWVARAIEREPADRRRKGWLTISLLANLGILGFFKYFNFFVQSGAGFLGWLGLPVDVPTLSIVLPLGISFYTFQTMSYTLDVYRRKLRAAGPLDFAVFVAFFPQLVAGPIVRASDFLPQLTTLRRWADVVVRPALTLFLIGYIKKACVADNIAPIVDTYFAAPATFTASAAVLAVMLYAVQIYCDFSGYSDMAIGTARLLGYDLCRNFDAPYLSASVTEFWRRWHISLSTWLRDYLYITLGGNRGPAWMTYRNLMLTMLLGGLWHGAAWTFVVWGALHGLALAAERALGIGVAAHGWRRLVRVPLTFWWVCVTWIFFRADGFPAAMITLKSFVLWDSPGTRSLPPFLYGVVAALAAVHVLTRLLHRDERPDAATRLPAWGYAVAYGAAFALATAALPLQYRPFIYFQF